MTGRWRTKHPADGKTAPEEGEREWNRQNGCCACALIWKKRAGNMNIMRRMAAEAWIFPIGVEMNLQHGGRQEEVLGDYETKLIEMMDSWQ